MAQRYSARLSSAKKTSNPRLARTTNEREGCAEGAALLPLIERKKSSVTQNLPSSLLSGDRPRTFIDPGRHRLWPILEDDERRAVERVLNRGVLSGNFAPEALAFQEEFGSFVGARHVLLTHSGTSALVLAVVAAGIRPGDEVIVPAYTFVATAQAVLAAGAIPVFADVDPETGLIDVSETEKWISEHTRAIMPVHVHGCPFDVEALAQLCERRGLVLLEDAAQAHGATYQGKPVGALASGGAFSFQSSKNLGAGEGGAYVTQELEKAELANQVRNFGHDLSLTEGRLNDLRRPLDGWRSLDSQRIGSMYRGNEMMAALARSLLKKLPARTRASQENAERLSARLRNLPGVLPPSVPNDRTSVHHKYRVRIDRDAAGLGEFPAALVRDALLAALKATGFEATLWERHPQNHHSIFAKASGLPAHILENYRSTFPRTEQLLDSSFLLFTQSCPLIAQDGETVDEYGAAFERFWEHRRAIVVSAAEARGA